ncbi:hypothetical protein [Variovorax rhizosphaerae]|uniref:Uncharacterized protein n=1 Tax=Variovorax rhizosphaerae TaxID=1836200 RepID=A0ABU8WT45_9BURK
MLFAHGYSAVNCFFQVQACRAIVVADPGRDAQLDERFDFLIANKLDRALHPAMDEIRPHRQGAVICAISMDVKLRKQSARFLAGSPPTSSSARRTQCCSCSSIPRKDQRGSGQSDREINAASP